MLHLVSSLLKSCGRFDRKPIILPPYAQNASSCGTKMHPTLAVYIADRFSILKAFLSSSIFLPLCDCRRVEVLRLGDYVLQTRAYYSDERSWIRRRIDASRSISRPRDAYKLVSPIKIIFFAPTILALIILYPLQHETLLQYCRNIIL